MRLMSEIDVGERSEVPREAWAVASCMLCDLIGAHIQLYLVVKMSTLVSDTCFKELPRPQD